MRIVWSLPIRGESRTSSRGDVVRAWSLVRGLRADGHDVVVVEDGAGAAARLRVAAYRRLVRRFLPRPVAWIVRDLGRVLHARRHARRVAAAARAHGAELLIETQVHLADSGRHAARATGLPLILDDCSPWTEEVALGAGLPRLARWVFDRQAAAANQVVVPSTHVRERLITGGVPRRQIRMVPNAIDPREYGRAARQRARRRPGPITLVFAGSFQPWHRVELLVESMAVLGDGYDLDLLLLGEGPGRGTACDVAERLGLGDRVCAPGALFSSLLPDVLGACDIGVLPATNDYGQPMKLLEYAAAGLPVIAPDVPTVRDVVEDGVTGVLFTPGDVGAFAAAIGRLAADPDLRWNMGRSARERCLRTATWTERARRLIGDFADGPGTNAVRDPAASERRRGRDPILVEAGS